MCGPISDCITIDGGLMAGKTVNPETAVVHSGMQSVIVLPRVEENERQCTGCGRCVSVCPVGKRPYSGAAEDGHKPCIGCGSCSYICPSRRRLKEWMVRGGGRKDGEDGKEGYIDLPEDGCGLPPAVVTGYSSPYIRLAKSPFTCILSPFKL